ncbi:MAG: GDSL-type esterase/lipase family protein [Desulfobacteraceae bacterium]|jgi:lysophospholipase L1-like esterase
MGDSRINVNWNKLMGRNDMVSIRGGQIEDILERVDFASELKPELCLVMIGINDMFWMKTPEKTFDDYKILIDKMLKKNMKIVIQSLIYVAPVKLFYKEQNKEVDMLNSMLNQYSKEKGILFLDLNSKLSKSGHLIMDYSSDGVHMSDKGYQVWKNELIPLLKTMNL